MKLGLGLGLAYGSGGGVAVPVGTTTSLTVEFVDASGGTLPHRVTCGAQEANLEIGDTEHTFTGLAYNTEYTVNVYAVDGEVESLALTVDVFTAPQYSPSGLTAEAQSESEIMLTWTDPVDPPASVGGGVEVWVSSNGTDYTLLDTVANAVEGYLHDGMTQNTHRWYKVRAFNDNPSPHDDSFAVFTDAVDETTDADVTAPTLTSATIAANGTALTLVFSEAVTRGAGYDDADWALDAAVTTGLSVAYVSGDGTTTWTMAISGGPVLTSATDDPVTIDWAGTADGIEDAAGLDLDAFSGSAVTNNSTQTVFTPADLSPVLWLNDTGSDDSVWTDQTANGYNLTQSNASLRPNIVTNNLKGKQVREFAQFDFLAAGSSAILNNASGSTIIAVAKHTGGDSYRTILNISYNGGVGPTRSALYARSTPSVEAAGRRIDTDAYQYVAVSWNTDEWAIVGTRADLINETLHVGKDGTLTARSGGFQTAGSGNYPNTNSAAISTGMPNGVSEKFAGSIAEIIVFATALSDVDYGKVNDWLYDKYLKP